MYLRIDWELYEKICKATSTDYNAVGEFLPGDNIISMLEDLLYEIELKNEQLEDIKKDLQENYKPISPAEQYEVNDKDFI